VMEGPLRAVLVGGAFEEDEEVVVLVVEEEEEEEEAIGSALTDADAGGATGCWCPFGVPQVQLLHKLFMTRNSQYLHVHPLGLAEAVDDWARSPEDISLVQSGDWVSIVRNKVLWGRG
jgi:hypothetical protein